MTKLDWRRARRTLEILGKAKWVLEAVTVLVALGFFFYLAPKDIWNTQPATGGDTGSHFWPLVTLVKHGLPEWHVKVWNPGNLAGEPQLVHYFPLPFLVMALLSVFVPLGLAFNIGTWLPMLLFPVCVYIGLKGLRARFPIPVLGVIAALCYFYNESYSMWGGNAVSTLAGQFAHVYAFDFFMLFLGAMSFELRRRRFPWLATLCACAVMLSHFYVALLLPLAYIGFLATDSSLPFKERFRRLAISAVVANLLAAWFVIPMLDNAMWTTPFGLKWGTANLFHEVLPQVLWPFAALLAIGAVVYAGLGIFRRKIYELEWKPMIFIFVLILLCSAGFYFIFPSLGLVDIRAIPAAQLVFCLLAVVYAGLLMRRYLDSLTVTYLTLGLVIVGVWWARKDVVNFPNWLKWNYSSWSAKPAYPQLQALTKTLKGDFSDPRVVYENNEAYNDAGTMRVFEMLPYFAGRSTLESVYMQATIVAPEAFYIQALISKSPSCPFPNYQCTPYNLQRAIPRLKLFAVSQVILSTPPLLEQAKTTPELEFQTKQGLWNLYRLKDPVSYVTFMRQPPRWVSFPDFEREFFNWFISDDFQKQWLITDPHASSHSAKAELPAELKNEKIYQAPADCQPTVKVDFNHFSLHTECPGFFHILKFADHVSWRSSHGEKIYLVSPGFIGVIPKQKDTTFYFAQRALWSFSVMLSWLTLIGFVLLWIFSELRHRREAAISNREAAMNSGGAVGHRRSGGVRSESESSRSDDKKSGGGAVKP
jgi:hypothetical protein